MTDAAKTDPRIEHLGQRFADLVYAAAVRQLGAGRGAEDVTQAVFLIALRKAKAGALPEERYMAAWLLKITHFAVKEVWHAQKMRRHHERQAATQRPETPAPGPDLESIRAALDQALLKLGTLDREVIARRYLQNQTVGNVAAAVGMAENTASQRIGRALEKLRKLLGHQGTITPAAALTTLMLTESTKSSPTSLLTTATGASAASTTAATSIAKRATAMMHAATAKALTLAICVALLFTTMMTFVLTHTARAQAPAPSASPTTGVAPPARTPTPGANEAKNLFMDTLSQLEIARDISLEATLERRMIATVPVPPEDQDSANQITTTSHIILLDRKTNNLSWTIVHNPFRPKVADGIRRTIFLIAHSSFFIADQFKDDAPFRGTVRQMKRMTTDDIFRSNECILPVAYPELADLLDSRAGSRFFQYATDWKWLGAASDNETKVWRVRFTGGQATPLTWEVWISQDQPHRLMRIISGRPSSMGISRVKPGMEFSLDGILDSSNSTSTEYKTFEQTQVTFTKWDTTTLIPEAAFQRPKADFKERTFDEAQWRFRVGDTVGLPALSDTAGNTVDLSKHTGPLVLFFWSALDDGSVPPKMAAVKTIAGHFTKQGVELYGINDQNMPDQITKAEAKDPAASTVSLLDNDHEVWKNFSVTFGSTTLVIGTDGKLLFREPIEGRASLGRLREALRKATAAPTVATHPASP